MTTLESDLVSECGGYQYDMECVKNCMIQNETKFVEMPITVNQV